MNNSHLVERTVRHTTRTLLAKSSYQAALSSYQTNPPWARISWVTWIITLGSILFWGFTAYQMANLGAAHSLIEMSRYVLHNAIDVQPDSDTALTEILIRYGAKDNTLIIQGQYWRFLTPLFLHANLLHVGLNMLNLAFLGVFLERIMGHLRFLFIYLFTGIISIIASFIFAPAVVSVGASGAIFGLVGAYCIFVLAHRRAFPYGGLFALLWLLLIVGLNLGVGLVVANVDNYAHLGGLISGCILGWWFTPLYQSTTGQQRPVDTHRLARSWPLALLTILGTLLLAILAIHAGN